MMPSRVVQLSQAWSSVASITADFSIARSAERADPVDTSATVAASAAPSRTLRFIRTPQLVVAVESLRNSGPRIDDQLADRAAFEQGFECLRCFAQRIRT